MILKILCSGSGGQGVLTLGNILGNAAMLGDFFVTFIPSYGAAMRGGTANCTISISDNEIASPVASAPDIVIAMNQPSVLSFINRLGNGGQMLYNSSITDDVPVRGGLEIIPVPANELATELGNERSVNMVMLGAFLKLTNVLQLEIIYKSIDKQMGSKKKIVQVSKDILLESYNRFPFNNQN